MSSSSGPADEGRNPPDDSNYATAQTLGEDITGERFEDAEAQLSAAQSNREQPAHDVSEDGHSAQAAKRNLEHQLARMIYRWHGREWTLFSGRSKKFLLPLELANTNLAVILNFFRGKFGDEIYENQKLKLRFPELELEYLEDDVSAQSQTVVEVMRLWIRLNTNEGVADPQPLTMVVDTFFDNVAQWRSLTAESIVGTGLHQLWFRQKVEFEEHISVGSNRQDYSNSPSEDEGLPAQNHASYGEGSFSQDVHVHSSSGEQYSYDENEDLEEEEGEEEEEEGEEDVDRQEQGEIGYHLEGNSYPRDEDGYIHVDLGHEHDEDHVEHEDEYYQDGDMSQVEVYPDEENAQPESQDEEADEGNEDAYESDGDAYQDDLDVYRIDGIPQQIDEPPPEADRDGDHRKDQTREGGQSQPSESNEHIDQVKTVVQDRSDGIEYTESDLEELGQHDKAILQNKLKARTKQPRRRFSRSPDVAEDSHSSPREDVEKTNTEVITVIEQASAPEQEQEQEEEIDFEIELPEEMFREAEEDESVAEESLPATSNDLATAESHLKLEVNPTNEVSTNFNGVDYTETIAQPFDVGAQSTEGIVETAENEPLFEDRNAFHERGQPTEDSRSIEAITHPVPEILDLKGEEPPPLEEEVCPPEGSTQHAEDLAFSTELMPEPHVAPSGTTLAAVTETATAVSPGPLTPAESKAEADLCLIDWDEEPYIQDDKVHTCSGTLYWSDEGVNISKKSARTPMNPAVLPSELDPGSGTKRARSAVDNPPEEQDSKRIKSD